MSNLPKLKWMVFIVNSSYTTSGIIQPDRNAHAGIRGVLPDIVIVALLMVLSCVFFWKVLIHPDHLVNFNDTVKQYYVWRHFAETQPGGIRPLWLPFINGGEPFVANPQNAQFYPIDKVLLNIFPTHLALGYGYVFHLFLAGFGMYFLVRHLTKHRSSAFVSASVFMFSGYIIAQTYAGHYTVISTVAWLPWIFLSGKLAVDRSSLFLALLASVPLGLQILAGLPQITYLTLVLLGMYAAFESVRKTCIEKQFRQAFGAGVLTVLIVVLGISLAAVQLLPTYELAQHSARSAGVTYGFATIYSLPFHGLTGILLPNLFGTPIDGSYLNTGPYWEFALYTGILPPLLIVMLVYMKKLDRTGVFFLGVAFLALILSLGNNTPLYWLMWKFVPGIDSFRVPARFLLLFTFSTAVLAGLGLAAIQSLISNRDKRQIHTLLKVFIVGTLILLAGILVAYVMRENLLEAGGAYLRRYYDLVGHAKFPYESAIQTLRATYASALVDIWKLLGLLFLAAIWMRWRVGQKEEAGTIFSIVTAIFIAGNLWIYYAGFVQTNNLEETYQETPYVTYLKNNAGIHRVYDKDFVLRHNQQMAHGIYTVAGYNALRLQNHWSVLKTLWSSPLSENEGALNILNVKYVVAKDPIEIGWLKKVYQENGTYIYENLGALPRAFIVQDAEVQQYSVLNTKEARMNVGRQASTNGVKIVTYAPNQISLAVEMEEPGILILSENYYPGWIAYVNGIEQPMFEAYGLLRGLRLEKGQHRIEFVFEPRSLALGISISGVSAVVLMMALGFTFFRNCERHPWKRALAGWKRFGQRVGNF
jgi:hypothetical protein